MARDEPIVSTNLRAGLGGLIGVQPKMPVRDNFALSVIYTPGVAEPCREIADDPDRSYESTWRWNAVALVGRGATALPRLESYAFALKLLAGVDGVPLVVGPQCAIAPTLRVLAPTYGGYWLIGFGAAEAGRARTELADLEIPVVRPPRDGEHCLADLSVFPGVFRALLDLRLRELDPRLIVEAVSAGDEDSLSFEAAPRVARAIADRAVELGLSRTGVTGDRIAARVEDYLETGRLEPFESGADWLAASPGREQARRLHRQLAGSLAMKPTLEPHDPARVVELFEGADDDAAAAIAENPALADRLTGRANMVAVVTDGSAVLGMGDIGAGAALPVMLGKSVLFKVFGGCDAVPICVDADDPAEIVDVVSAVAPSFGGINLEDISAPRCFEIEAELQRRLDIFVFHDDQHGTAVVTLAALLNAARLAGKSLGELTVTFNGAGAAGIAVTKLFLAAGVEDVILCDRAGAIYEGRSENMNPMKETIARVTNRGQVRGGLAEALKGRDVFVGLSAAGAVTADMVRSMAPDPIVFAMANPVPEIMPDEAYAAGAAAVATGRSDFANQVNNCLGFPGIFRGALDVKARAIDDEMKIAAAEAIAGLVGGRELRHEYFVPSAMDLRVPPAVAAAIARTAIENGAAQVAADPEAIALRTRQRLYRGG
ncbi:MAG: malic enzyme-like NAD(P)-binding protein [Planctomycetota bacterium]